MAGSRAVQCTLGHKVIKMKIWFSDFTLSWQNSLYFQPGEAIFFNFLLKKCHTFMCPNMGTFGPFFAISGKNNRDFSNDVPETPLTQERRGWFFYCRFPTKCTQSGAKIKVALLCKTGFCGLENGHFWLKLASFEQSWFLHFFLDFSFKYAWKWSN